MSNYTQDEIPPVLQNLTSQWIAKIAAATRWKEKVFMQNARELNQYYQGPKSWDELMGNLRAPMGASDLYFKGCVNKAFEFVSIFGPSLYQENPVRTVKPRAPVQVPGHFFSDPFTFQQLAMAEQSRVAIDGLRSILLEAYLNWTPARYKLDVESRKAINEALVTGRGLLWTELVQSPDGAFRSVVSRFGSVRDLIVDPDATSIDRAKWIARRCVQPCWQVERDYGLRPGSLKGNFESHAVQAELILDQDVEWRRAAGQTADLLVFYQLWSKMGIGGRLANADQNLRKSLDEIFGDYCYLVISPSCRFPLNLPPDLVNDDNRFDDVLRSAAWPIPFWAGDKWPFSELDFHRVADSPWPMAHLSAAKGELRLLNWVFSFIAGHVRNASRDFVVVKKSLAEEVKTALIDGRDLSLLELDIESGTIDDAIKFLQHPPANADIWKFIEYIQENFDKRVGLSELMYGTSPSTQPRSAAESNIRDQSAGIRPDDMASQVESWAASVAEKEAFCARYLLSGGDVSVCLGPLASQAWTQWVFTEDASEAFHSLEYRIESGSTRRPNKEYQVRQMTEAMQVLAPIFQAYASQTGDLAPLNNLIADFAKSRDLDPNRYQLNAAPMPPMLPPSSPGSPSSGGESAVAPATGEPQLG